MIILSFDVNERLMIMENRTIVNQNKMAAILFQFPMVFDKMAPILFKTEHYWKIECHWRTRGLPLEFRLRSVFQPPLKLKNSIKARVDNNISDLEDLEDRLSDSSSESTTDFRSSTSSSLSSPRRVSIT